MHASFLEVTSSMYTHMQQGYVVDSSPCGIPHTRRYIYIFITIKLYFIFVKIYKYINFNYDSYDRKCRRRRVRSYDPTCGIMTIVHALCNYIMDLISLIDRSLIDRSIFKYLPLQYTIGAMHVHMFYN